MSKHHFNELAGIQAALSTLRQYNKYVWFPVPEKEFDNPIILDYFLSPLNSLTERTVEKVVCAAAVKYVFDNPNIPDQNKEQSAKNTARDIRDAIRYAKLEYLVQTSNLSLREYNRRKMSIPIVKCVERIQMAKDIVKAFTIKTIVSFIADPSGGHIVDGIYILWSILPGEVREKIISRAEDGTDKAVNTIRNFIETIRSTEIGKTIEIYWLTDISPSITKITDDIRNKAKVILERIKSYKKYKSDPHEK